MRILYSFVCVALLASVAHAAGPATVPATTTTVGPGGIEIIHDLEIARVGDDFPLLVDIARPKKADKPMPAVLCVHGGGWSGGTKYLRLDLAQHGYVVVGVAYRLAGKNLWPAQIQDCKTAVRWMRANAGKYNINPDKIGATGHSAGGHLVACLGTMMNIPQFEEGPFPGFSSEVQAVADYAGPTDLAMLFHHKSPANLFGPNGQEHPELMDKASPIHYVSSKCPPFFIAQGDHDKLVPMQQAEILNEAMKKAGVPVEFVLQKNGGHSLGSAKTDGPCEPTADELRERSQKFFDKYLK